MRYAFDDAHRRVLSTSQVPDLLIGATLSKRRKLHLLFEDEWRHQLLTAVPLC